MREDLGSAIPASAPPAERVIDCRPLRGLAACSSLTGRGSGTTPGPV